MIKLMLYRVDPDTSNYDFIAEVSQDINGFEITENITQEILQIFLKNNIDKDYENLLVALINLDTGILTRYNIELVNQFIIRKIK